MIDLYGQYTRGGHLLSLKQDVYGHRQFLNFPLNLHAEE
jgi:hypothetical protein